MSIILYKLIKMLKINSRLLPKRKRTNKIHFSEWYNISYWWIRCRFGALNLPPSDIWPFHSNYLWDRWSSWSKKQTTLPSASGCAGKPGGQRLLALLIDGVTFGLLLKSSFSLWWRSAWLHTHRWFYWSKTGCRLETFKLKWVKHNWICYKSQFFLWDYVV